MMESHASASATNPPETTEAFYALGHWLLETRRVDDALCVFRTMILASPSDERAWLGLSTCHEHLGHLAVAEKILALATRGFPSSYRIALALARIQRALGNELAAEPSFETAHDLALATEGEEIARAIACERSAS
jgi:hypothetical protein